MRDLSRAFWIGVGLSLALLVLFVVTIDLGRMGRALAEANYLYLVPGVALYLISVLFRTVRWQVLLRHMGAVPLRRLYPVVVVGYMANNLLPMRMGELVRSYYLGRREGLSTTSTLATILVERVLDAVTLLLFIAVIGLFFPLTGLAQAFGDRYGVPWPLLVLALSVPFIVAFAALVFLARFPDRIDSATATAVRPLPRALRTPARNLVRLFHQGIAPLRDPKTLALLLLLSLPIWLFESALFFLVGVGFGLHDSFGSLGEFAAANVLVTAIANIGSSIPAAPGGIGLFELVARETLVLLPNASIDRAVAAGFATVVHAALLIPMIVLGQLFLWTGHVSLRKLSRGVPGASDADAESVQVSSRGPLSYESEEGG